MAIDVEALRADTPGCERVVHLNNAGASLPPRPVLDAVVAHLRREAEIGGYEAEAAAAPALARTREALGALVGADHRDVALSHSDTGAWTKALWGLALGGWFDRGGRVLVDRIAYSSHYFSLLQLAERSGVSVEVVASREDGSLDLEDLDRLLDGPVRLVTATHVPTHRGLVNPVAEVGARCAHSGVPFFLDACQSAGQLPLDVGAIGCAVATGTGRKFLRGPRGTGWLYVAPEWSARMVPPGIDSTSAAWVGASEYELAPRAARFEEFESFVAGRIGLGVAVAYAAAIGIEAIAERIAMLAEGMRAALAAAGATVHDGGTVRSAIVTFAVPGVPARAVASSLADAGINVTVTEAVGSRLDMVPRGLDALVRASPHAYNTEEEVDRLVAHVAGLVLAASPTGSSVS